MEIKTTGNGIVLVERRPGGGVTLRTGGGSAFAHFDEENATNLMDALDGLLCSDYDVKQRIKALAEAHGLDVEVKRKPPVWQRGDVILLQHTNKSGPDFTWIKGSVWHDEDGEPASEEYINSRFQLGLVQHVLRDGKPVTA